MAQTPMLLEDAPYPRATDRVVADATGREAPDPMTVALPVVAETFPEFPIIVFSNPVVIELPDRLPMHVL